MTYLIVCPLLFLAGFVDAIGGGGGLISLPAYLLAGLPVHNAIATNKLSNACGTTLAAWKFIRRGLVNWRLAVPTVFAAVAGSFCGARASLAVDEAVMAEASGVGVSVFAKIPAPFPFIFQHADSPKPLRLSRENAKIRYYANLCPSDGGPKI